VSLSVTYDSTVTVEETLTGNAPFAVSAKKKVTHDQFDTSATLNAGTTPPATTFAAFQQALTSGAATIDLTNVTGTNGATVNFTGLKLQLVKLRNPITNANTITIAKGASSGYALGGSAFSITLQPGEEWTYKGVDTSPDVGGSSKHLDLSGTAAQALDVYLVGG